MTRPRTLAMTPVAPNMAIASACLSGSGKRPTICGRVRESKAAPFGSDLQGWWRPEWTWRPQPPGERGGR